MSLYQARLQPVGVITRNDSGSIDIDAIQADTDSVVKLDTKDIRNDGGGQTNVTAYLPAGVPMPIAATRLYETGSDANTYYGYKLV